MQSATRWLLRGLVLASLCVLAGIAASAALHVPDLPPEARDTLAIVERSGPFPYQRDGVVFGNYEQHLPVQRRGYYREYTVPTPGIAHRGARRLIVGCERGRRTARTFDGCSGPPRIYYTDDHYRSFREVLLP